MYLKIGYKNSEKVRISCEHPVLVYLNQKILIENDRQ